MFFPRYSKTKMKNISVDKNRPKGRFSGARLFIESFAILCFCSMLGIQMYEIYVLAAKLRISNDVENDKRLRGGDQERAPHENAHIDPYWNPLGPGRFSEYKDGSNNFKLLSAKMQREADVRARSRRLAVRNAMKHAWSGYKTHAWGSDELLPKSQSHQDNWGGMGTSLVDSLDTLWLMGLKDEFWEARDWVNEFLNNGVKQDVSVFETTKRNLGGLLSAYALSGDKIFLQKAEDLGERLFFAFEDSSSGFPFGLVNLHYHYGTTPSWVGNGFVLSEATSLALEFRQLSELTENEEFASKATRVYEILRTLSGNSGLVPWKISNNGEVPHFGNDLITVGAMGDSYYEYLLKIWLQGGMIEDKYRAMYDKAMDDLHDQLLYVTPQKGLTFLTERKGSIQKQKMDHFACFMAGNLALGAYTDPDGLESPRAQRDLKTGKALAYTCYQMYAQSKTGLGPEVVLSSEEEDLLVYEPRYLLRPEAVESFFVLYQLTGDPTYQEWGWEVFQAIERFCKTKSGYGGREDIDIVDEEPNDRMGSFFMGETLKYLYLLQDPDTEISILSKHVFNTGGHPLPLLKRPSGLDSRYY